MNRRWLFSILSCAFAALLPGCKLGGAQTVTSAHITKEMAGNIIVTVLRNSWILRRNGIPLPEGEVGRMLDRFVAMNGLSKNRCEAIDLIEYLTSDLERRMLHEAEYSF